MIYIIFFIVGITIIIYLDMHLLWNILKIINEKGKYFMIYHNSFLKIFLKKNINKDRFENNINKNISKQFFVSFSK